MANIELNVYKKGSKKDIAKTHTVDGYELMLGTVEDFMNIIDVDKLGDSIEATKMVMKCYKQIAPLLKDIFPELTDEDLRNVKATEVVKCIKQVGAAILDGFDILKSGN